MWVGGWTETNFFPFFHALVTSSGTIFYEMKWRFCNICTTFWYYGINVYDVKSVTGALYITNLYNEFGLEKQILKLIYSGLNWDVCKFKEAPLTLTTECG